MRERPPTREPTPEPAAHDAQSNLDEDDAASEASSSGLPPPLLPGTSYDALVCSDCVQKIPILRRYAGTPGVLMVVRDTPTSPWKVVGKDVSESTKDSENVDVTEIRDSSVTAGQKRPRSGSEGADIQVKRPREDSDGLGSTKLSSPCIAPPPNPVAHDIINSMGAPQPSQLGAGDIFLTDGWRDRWCRCPEV